MTPEERLLVAEAKAERLRADTDALERAIRVLQGQRDRLLREQCEAWDEATKARHAVLEDGK